MIITHVFCFFVDQLNYTFLCLGLMYRYWNNLQRLGRLAVWATRFLVTRRVVLFEFGRSLIVGRGSKAFFCFIMSNHAVNVQFALKEIGFQEYDVWRYEPQKHYRTIISHICYKSDATYVWRFVKTYSSGLVDMISYLAWYIFTPCVPLLVWSSKRWLL